MLYILYILHINTLYVFIRYYVIILIFFICYDDTSVHVLWKSGFRLNTGFSQKYACWLKSLDGMENKIKVNECSTVTLNVNELLKIVSYGTEGGISFNAYDKQYRQVMLVQSILSRMRAVRVIYLKELRSMKV